MIEIIYKDGTKQDVTNLFGGRINIDNYYYTMLTIADLDCVDKIEVSEPKGRDKWTRETGKTRFIGKSGWCDELGYVGEEILK